VHPRESPDYAYVLGLCLTIICMSISDRHGLQEMNHAAGYHDITNILHPLLQIYSEYDRHQILLYQNRPGLKEDASYVTKTCWSFFALRCSFFTLESLKFLADFPTKILTAATHYTDVELSPFLST